ncbi:MAG: hypothetical protein BM559_08265 [Roseobacter sp. MedPE-SWchi]|nr:MAG: hypothetical protein BM559_08265 [Roseobacter sp. MedPE-SWchi]
MGLRSRNVNLTLFGFGYGLVLSPVLDVIMASNDLQDIAGPIDVSNLKAKDFPTTGDRLIHDVEHHMVARSDILSEWVLRIVDANQANGFGVDFRRGGAVVRVAWQSLISGHFW